MKSAHLLIMLPVFTVALQQAICAGGPGDKSSNLVFNPGKYILQTITDGDRSIKVRAYENIVYVENPVDTMYQKMNIYIPEEYFNGGTINGYNKSTAPIFFPNNIGGYMPALPATALQAIHGPFPGGKDNRESSIVFALERGYVVASAGARGRITKDKNGTYTGKAPSVIIDLKAAVRYLRLNDVVMPGNAEKIISNGTSAGGALSVLLGASGNNSDFDPYLKALGAAGVTDNIFAVSAYCPITNLDNADAAYEWQFNGINNYKKRSFPPAANGGNEPENSTLTEKQVKISAKLKEEFPQYLNSLKLKDQDGKPLTLDVNGKGSFRDYVRSWVIKSAQKAYDEGADLSKLKWITIDNGKISGLDFDAYLVYLERMKTPPAFDAIDLNSPENQLFGNENTDKRHFTMFSASNSGSGSLMADALQVKMMNPMNYIGQPGTVSSAHWRIRHGTKDKDTGLAIPVILGTFLQNRGYDVDLALPWDKPHGGDYDLKELFDWCDRLCK